MTDSPSPYTRLTRATAGVSTYSALWLGPDHLLQTATTGFMESYRRYYFRDIQALYLEPTKRRVWWSWLFGAVAAFFFLVVWVESESFTAAAILGGILSIPIFWNLALGPGCRVYLLTGVQLVHVPSLVRFAPARQLLARLQPIILAAQADLAPPSPPPLPPSVTPIVPAEEPLAAAPAVSAAEPPSP